MALVGQTGRAARGKIHDLFGRCRRAFGGLAATGCRGDLKGAGNRAGAAKRSLGVRRRRYAVADGRTALSSDGPWRNRASASLATRSAGIGLPK